MNSGRSELSIDTIDRLCTELRGVAEDCAARNDRVGYFAALYTLMTERVRADIERERFRDGARLERLACHFAGRYLVALERYRAGEPAPQSWVVAFETADHWRPLILQHLMLGMNAHINFDLGIAAAEVADDDDLARVRDDFFEINDVLAELFEVIQRRMAVVSPWLGILDQVGGRKDDAVVNFSMRRARDAAWRVAETYAPLDAAARLEAERELDARFARFAQVVVKPGRLITTAALLIRLRELASPGEVIEVLCQADPL